MGSERAYTIRRREAGHICYRCDRMADPPPGWFGERLCNDCAAGEPGAERTPYRVCVTFVNRMHGWLFWYSLNGRTIKGPLSFDTGDVIVKQIAATHTQRNMRFDQQVLDAIKSGQGKVFLDLTCTQFARLSFEPPWNQPSEANIDEADIPL